MKKKINSIFDEIVDIRRYFHMHPELSEMEENTSDKICQYLDSWGIEYKRHRSNLGVTAIIRGREDGITVGARADIDALPVSEENDLPFKSVNKGVMHACGHDLHIAIHLGVAKLFKEMEDEIKGNVKIFFQPAEETVGGANEMIREGCLEDPHVDYVLSLHVMPYIEAGQIELKYGKFNASINEFDIKITGKSSHSAYPEKSVDSVVVAAHVITALQSIVSRNISALNSLVISIGEINGGTKSNIIAGEVDMTGTLRALDKDTRNYAKKRIREVVENTARAHGALGQVHIKEGYPALINDSEVLAALEAVAKEEIGLANIHYKEFPSMGGDDFSFFCEQTKAAYYNLGCGNQEKGWTDQIHSEHFIADEECIKTGLLLQMKTMMELLKES